jgi:protein-S-isoprenylcysteine O-methyltransferase Ste14
LRAFITLKVFTILSATVYLRLAVVGEGGFQAYFSRPPLVALAMVVFLLAFSSLFTEGNMSSGQREDRSNRWVLVIFSIVGILSGWLPAYTDRIGFLSFGGEAVRALGVIMVAVGGSLRLYPVFVLGNRFSGLVVLQPGHKLVTTGIDRHIRNPSYLGLLVTSLGWALAFRSFIGILLVLCLLPPLVARIHSEENLLQSQFGEEYAAYKRHSWRLLPGIY